MGEDFCQEEYIQGGLTRLLLSCHQLVVSFSPQTGEKAIPKNFGFSECQICEPVKVSTWGVVESAQHGVCLGT